VTERSRPPTDEQRTAIYDPERDPNARPPQRGARVELATPTEVTPPRQESQPIRVISLKAPSDPSEERRPVAQHQPRLRQLSELASPRQRVATPPGGLGYLAPPRDPHKVRPRRWGEYLMWGSAVVILAGAVMLGVWLLAGM
jgi:hypothetical protein